VRLPLCRLRLQLPALQRAQEMADTKGRAPHGAGQTGLRPGEYPPSGYQARAPA